jgi:hypothetical protein
MRWRWSQSECWRRKTHRRAYSLHVLKSLLQSLAFGLLRLPKLLLHLLPLGLPLRLRRLMSCLEVCFHLGPQYLIPGLEYKANVCKNQGTMDEAKITLSAAIWLCAVSGRGRMAGLELVLQARICERVGVLAVSSVLSAIQCHASCLLPPS